MSARILVLSGLCTALTAVGAFIKIPFYPVPFTLQTLFTALAALLLPPRWATLSQAAYLSLGLLGLPVFANGGGLGYVMQPTFGYLLLLPASACVISTLKSRTRDISLMKVVLILLLGMLMILCGGAVWLYFHIAIILRQEVSFWHVFYAGVAVFIPSMLVKAAVAALFWQELDKRRPHHTAKRPNIEIF
ncbi:biotin transporter BioY [candidate division KSB1 bacterium]|nr:biotin transporter BioY [candidate division KSB1 bacterium]